MKKNIVKLGLLLVCAVTVLDLTGGRLAQPERHTPDKDRFIGFHLVPETVTTVVGEDGSEWEQIGDNDRSHWVEYGTEEMELDGVGSVSFPREILIGIYNEQSRRYDFPGKEGYNCFLAIRTDEDGARCVNGYTDMTENHVALSDTENTLTGTLYVDTCAEGLAYDWILTAYRVYQMEDGTVYLDGTGNSYGGAGFTINERAEYTTTVNGEVTTEVLEVEFSLKDSPDIQAVFVSWFDAEANVLEREELDLAALAEEEILARPQAAAWAMVEEVSGTGAVTRTVCEPNYTGWASHQLILTDETGIGQPVSLTWKMD